MTDRITKDEARKIALKRRNCTTLMDLADLRITQEAADGTTSFYIDVRYHLAEEVAQTASSLRGRGFEAAVSPDGHQLAIFY